MSKRAKWVAGSTNLECKRCGREAPKNRRKQEFCSADCRLKWHTSRRRNALRLLENEEADADPDSTPRG
jgi:hypothetical protein